MRSQAVAPFALALTAACTFAAAVPPTVGMTWMSIANGSIKIGDKRNAMDGHVSRIAANLFVVSTVISKDMYTPSRRPHVQGFLCWQPTPA